MASILSFKSFLSLYLSINFINFRLFASKLIAKPTAYDLVSRLL